MIDSRTIQATDVKHQVFWFMPDKRRKQFINQPALSTVRNHQIVIIANPKCPDGLLNVKLKFFLNLPKPSFSANVDDVDLCIFREISEKPIRLSVDIFVGGLKRRVVFVKSLNIPIWYKQYLHFALFRRSLLINICLIDDGQHAIIAINTIIK